MAQQIINIGTSNNSGDGEGLRTAFYKVNDNFTELYRKYNGFIDYNDLNTASNPINIGTDYTLITNDGLGSETIRDYLPFGITDIFNTSTSLFDFQDLKLGDMINYRLNMTITTTSNSQEVWFKTQLGIGGFQYDSTTKYWQFKTAGTYPITVDSYFDMGNLNTLNNAARFVVKSDNNCTLINHGVRCKITLY